MNGKLLSKNYILTVISATLLYISSFMINTVCARYVTDSGKTQSMAGIVAAVFTLASFFMRPLWGWLTDKWGRKAVYLSGTAFSLIAYILLWINNGILLLVVSRILAGAGYSAFTTAGGTIVCDVVPQEKLQQGIAVYGITNVLSQAIAPVVALWLYNIDFIYVVLCALVVNCLVLLFALPIKYKEKLFIAPDSKFCLYNKSALPAAYTIIFFAMATASVNSFIPVFAKQQGITADSWFFLISAAFLLVTRLYNKKLISSIGEKKTFYSGDLVYIAGFVLLTICKSNLLLLIAAAFYGCGAGLIHPIVNTAAVKDSGKAGRGTATSTFMMSQDLGMTIGAFLWGTISGAYGFSLVYTTVVLLLFVMMYVFRKFLASKIN